MCPSPRIPAPPAVPIDLASPAVYTLSVEEAAGAFRVSKTKGYEAVASGSWPSIRVGSRIRIPASWVRDQLGIVLSEAE